MYWSFWLFYKFISRVVCTYTGVTVCNCGQVRDIHSRIKNEFFQYVLLNLERVNYVIHCHEHQLNTSGFSVPSFYIGIHQTVTFMLVVREGQVISDHQDHIFSAMCSVNHGHIKVHIWLSEQVVRVTISVICVIPLGKRGNTSEFYTALSCTWY